MKIKIFVIVSLLLAMNTNAINAQIRLSFNIGLQPLWGPVGYDRVENYYLPEIDAYYNIESRQYTYIVNGRWISTMSLPYQYRNYDLYNGYKVVMNEPRPYLHYNSDRVKYAPYKNQHDQQPIRDSRDQKYFENKNHPQHNEWRRNENQNQRDQQNNRRDNRRDNRDNRDNRENKDNNDRGKGKERERG
jgi:hypothetical protein